MMKLVGAAANTAYNQREASVRAGLAQAVREKANNEISAGNVLQTALNLHSSIYNYNLQAINDVRQRQEDLRTLHAMGKLSDADYQTQYGQLDKYANQLASQNNARSELMQGLVNRSINGQLGEGYLGNQDVKIDANGNPIPGKSLPGKWDFFTPKEFRMPEFGGQRSPDTSPYQDEEQ
ncbi:MAG: hypothetical protein KGJ13_02230 [Patescibacteria group bacterium]|nr:hypothetical protein [Patescibacteria group bacterium]